MQKYTKAIVALIMAIIGIANLAFGVAWNVDEMTVTTVVSAVLSLLTPVLVYYFPNKGQ